MRYTLTTTEEHWAQLQAAIFSEADQEGAAFLLCGSSLTADETRLLVREVVPVRTADYLVREALRLSIDSRAYARVAKQALATSATVMFVHSHPKGIAEYSPQDDREEPKLMTFLSQRNPERRPGSLVVSGPQEVRGRIWTDGKWAPIERVRILGHTFRLIDVSDDAAPPEWFDRQVAAFGPDLQRVLGRVHVGVVGAGGTGSATAEMLCRLGVGALTLFDGDTLEGTNVTRVYGSRMRNVGENKAVVLGRHIEDIGLGTKVHVVPEFIDRVNAAKKMRECDFVFGCTDLEGPRGHMVQLSLRYLVPVLDIGVKISSDKGSITDITGRVTLLFPGYACLFCRRRITAERIRLEQTTPEERRRLIAEGYAPALHQRDPAVVMFTNAIASQAVMEFVHRLTGFMGEQRRSTEVLPRYLTGQLGKNGEKPAPDCLCSRRELWGKGDSRDFLGVTWAA